METVDINYLTYLFLFILTAYLLGSLNFAIILCKLFGYADPRSEGSMNPGATNVNRVANKYLALTVLIFDALKGFVPVFIYGYMYGLEFETATIGLAAFIGHLYPLFFKFKGGKGVATFLGVIAALYYPVFLLFVFVWVLVAILTRYSSLGAISAVCVSPVYLLWFGKYYMLLPIVIMVLLLLIKHKENIKRLMAGTESKLKF